MISLSTLVPQILLQTSDWLALNKPAGWLTIPGRNTQAPILNAWAEEQVGKVWVVHRLDVETSGVVLFALHADAHRQANSWFEKSMVRKSYLALCQGGSARPMFRVNVPVNGLASQTRFEVLGRFQKSNAMQVAAFPQSGRRHQIRIHLASQGYPILGDETYHGPRSITRSDRGILQVARVALHASRLQLPDSVKTVIEAPLPEDFKEWLNFLGE